MATCELDVSMRVRVVDAHPMLPGAAVVLIVRALVGEIGVPTAPAETVLVLAGYEGAKGVGSSIRVVVAPLLQKQW